MNDPLAFESCLVCLEETRINNFGIQVSRGFLPVDWWVACYGYHNVHRKLTHSILTWRFATIVIPTIVKLHNPA